MPAETALGPGLLRGVDLASFAVSLAVRLRGAGVSVGFTGIERFTRALAASPPDELSRLYWTARITLVSRHSDLGAFDAVFAAVFDDAVLRMDPHSRRTPFSSAPREDDRFASIPTSTDAAADGDGLPWITLPPVVAPAEDSDSELGIPERVPSRLGGLADTPFEQLSAMDLETLGRWLESARAGWPTRRTRRLKPWPSGHRIALRPTLARARRTGWEPIELVHVRPIRKPRRVVMLCDVSQSMQAQVPAYLHLMRVLALATDAEVFAFATTLTRLTSVLAHKSAAEAIEAATERVSDRFGGTRIAVNVQRLLSSHHGGLTRGAIVIIGSDGWDSGTPEELAAAMARLRRRAYRVIWMNPRAAAPGFAPLVATMAAALPFCDVLLPADTFGALAGVVTELGRSDERFCAPMIRSPDRGGSSPTSHARRSTPTVGEDLRCPPRGGASRVVQ